MAGEKKSNIYCWEIESDELNIYLASSRRGAVRIGLSLKGGLDSLAYFKKIFPGGRSVRDYQMNRPLIDAVEDAFGNRPITRNPSFDIKGTPFQLKAWQAIARIPYGQTRTYGEVARMMGRPGSARAVGQAMGRNPLPLFFP